MVAVIAIYDGLVVARDRLRIGKREPFPNDIIAGCASFNAAEQLDPDDTRAREPVNVSL